MDVKLNPLIIYPQAVTKYQW